MFAVPWYNRVMLGTTDTLIDRATLEPRPLEKEIDFVLETAGQYLAGQPGREDVRSAFAGLRPLAAPETPGKATKEISRHHKIMVSVSGLVSVIGGKWTTYRKMAEDAVDYAIMVGGLPDQPCLTQSIRIHGYSGETTDYNSPMHVYGTERNEVEEMDLQVEYLSESLQITKSQVIWAVRKEMARTLEDVLARRTRALFLDVRESLAMAPEAARLMATELGKGNEWIRDQLDQYGLLARRYLVDRDLTSG
jgi:glycerol-3-phosphate dehydrogenase